MALSRPVQLNSSYQLSAGGCETYISCPTFFVKLLSVTLSGWRVVLSATKHPPDLSVTFDDNHFEIVSDSLDLATGYSDLVDTLNVVLIALAGLYAKFRSDKAMIHCAAFISNNGLSTLVLGGKKSGKSSLTWQSACSGGTVLADDILLWNERAGNFECLGMPVRLRRPVQWNGEPEALKKGILAGKRLAYTRNSIISIAPVGYIFVPDEILGAESVGVFKPIPVLKIKHALQEARIS